MELLDIMGLLHYHNTKHPKIIISNHKSHLDSCVLWSIMPKGVTLCFAAKKELFAIPIFGKILHYSGSIVIDRQNAHLAMQSLKDFFSSDSTKTLVIYAEGTRSKTDKLLPFKRGPFVIAKEMKIPILPVIIHGTAQALPSGKLWPQTATVTVKVLDMLAYEYLELEGSNTIRSELWQIMQENLQCLSAKVV
jgi:1-acyl-sn-glycerol-3-phosphate acyltransferase